MQNTSNSWSYFPLKIISYPWRDDYCMWFSGNKNAFIILLFFWTDWSFWLGWNSPCIIVWSVYESLSGKGGVENHTVSQQVTNNLKFILKYILGARGCVRVEHVCLGFCLSFRDLTGSGLVEIASLQTWFHFETSSKWFHRTGFKHLIGVSHKDHYTASLLLLFII